MRRQNSKKTGLKKQQPKVSAIMITYDQSDITRALLESFRIISYDHVEIIVINNGSVNSGFQAPEVKGVYVGGESAIGADSVVVGNPARVIRKFNHQTGIGERK